jgi:hypothetical protein
MLRHYQNVSIFVHVYIYYTWRGKFFLYTTIEKKGPPLPCMWSMNGEKRHVVIDEPVEFERQPFEFEDFQDNHQSF